MSEKNSSNLNENGSKIENGVLMEIDINKLEDYPNHPFKVLDDEKMFETVDSVQQYGVLVPAIVRPKENGNYEIVSGHRRKRACLLGKIKKMLCVVRNLTDDEATIIMVDSNIQRENILPSEKAFAYKMKLDALKHQGKRLDLVSELTSDHDGPKSKRANEQLTNMWGDSVTQIKRYIRLTKLIPELLELVDKDKISVPIGAELSFLTISEQNHLIDIIHCYEATPSKSQAQKMKKLSQYRQLNVEKIEEIMMEEKGNQIPKYEFSYTRIKQFVPREIETVNEVETYMLKCVKYCRENKINIQQIKLDEPSKKKDRGAR